MTEAKVVYVHHIVEKNQFNQIKYDFRNFNSADMNKILR